MGASGKDMAPLEVESENARITAQPKEGDAAMRIQNKYFASLLVSGAAASTASAAANPTAFCANLGTASTQCQTAGNVQINDALPAQFQPQYPYLGGLGIYHHGHGH